MDLSHNGKKSVVKTMANVINGNSNHFPQHIQLVALIHWFDTIASLDFHDIPYSKILLLFVEFVVFVAADQHYSKYFDMV